jgi:hypothetical protein
MLKSYRGRNVDRNPIFLGVVGTLMISTIFEMCSDLIEDLRSSFQPLARH